MIQVSSVPARRLKRSHWTSHSQFTSPFPIIGLRSFLPTPPPKKIASTFLNFLSVPFGSVQLSLAKSVRWMFPVPCPAFVLLMHTHTHPAQTAALYSLSGITSAPHPLASSQCPLHTNQVHTIRPSLAFPYLKPGCVMFPDL